MRQNLLTVNDLTGNSRTVPGVLLDLKDIVRMTEAATVRVLEEVEALLDEGQACSLLIGQAQGASTDRDAPGAAPLAEVQALVERGNGRLMAIMSALAFQDLTAQKIQRAFEVLEEVNIRLGKIHHLVSFGADEPLPEPPVAEPEPADGQSGQDLADEILRRFER